MPLTDYSIHPLHAHTFSAEGGRGGGLNLQQNFQKGDFIGPQLLKGGLLGIRGDFFQGWGEGGVQFSQKNKLKSEIFNDKKSF